MSTTTTDLGDVTVKLGGKDVKVRELSKADRATMGSAEAKAKRNAAKHGDAPPATPVLDWMNSATSDFQEHKAKEAAENGGKKGNGGQGHKVNMTDEQIAEVVRELALQGYVTKGAILKQLRGTPRGTRQQRLFPIADKVLTAMDKAGELPEPNAETKVKKAAPKKAATTKASAKKAPATTSKPKAKKVPAAKKAASAKDPSPTELGKQHQAAKAAEARKAAKEVAPRFKGAAAKSA